MLPGHNALSIAFFENPCLVVVTVLINWEMIYAPGYFRKDFIDLLCII